MECLEVPIGFYSPEYNNSYYPCTKNGIPDIESTLFAFTSNSFADNCSFTFYQGMKKHFYLNI